MTFWCIYLSWVSHFSYIFYYIYVKSCKILIVRRAVEMHIALVVVFVCALTWIDWNILGIMSGGLFYCDSNICYVGQYPSLIGKEVLRNSQAEAY